MYEPQDDEWRRQRGSPDRRGFQLEEGRSADASLQAGHGSMVDEAGLTRAAARADVSHVRGRWCLARSRWSLSHEPWSRPSARVRGALGRTRERTISPTAASLAVCESVCLAVSPVPAVRPFRCEWSVLGTPPVALRDRAERAPRRTQHRQPRMAGVRARHRTRSRGSHALPALDPQAHAHRRASRRWRVGWRSVWLQRRRRRKRSSAWPMTTVMSSAAG